MSKLKSAISLVIVLIFFSGCQTVKDKTDAIVEKENEKLSKFLGKSASELQMELGKPDEDFKNAKGNFELVYNSKKYLVPCERRFEINPEKVIALKHILQGSCELKNMQSFSLGLLFASNS